MRVILNNGTRITISKELAQLIFNALIKSREEAQRWQITIDGSKMRAINPAQISMICEEEDIIEPQK